MAAQRVSSRARQWRPSTSSSVRKVSAEKGLDYLEVRYEDLHADGPRVLGGVFERLGVDAGEPTVARCLEAASFERASGGRRRGQTDAGSFYRKGETGDWRNHMDSDLSERLLTLTEGLAVDLGYG